MNDEPLWNRRHPARRPAVIKGRWSGTWWAELPDEEQPFRSFNSHAEAIAFADRWARSAS